MNLSSIKVSVVIPVRNEEKYIKKCIESILFQDYPKNELEVIFVDGVSEDSTVDIIKEYAQKHEYIRLVSNPHKFVQHALNIGMKMAIGEYIVRMDAHSEYENDYITNCINFIEETGASNVGGPMHACARSSDTGCIPGIQSVVAAAYHSSFALGGGKNHALDYEGFADTVFLGAFRKSDIERLGYYDERLIRNEDDDLCFRMKENGMKIFITPKIKSIYFPRSKYREVFKQYFEYGMWKVAVIKKHGNPARLSHIIPMMFVAFLVIFGIGSIFSKVFRWIFFPTIALYVILNAYFSFTSKKVSSLSDKFKLMLVHFLMHISYGLGFWAGIIKFRNFNK